MLARSFASPARLAALQHLARLVAGLATLLCACAAWAQVPPLLDRVPAGVPLTVAVRSLASLDVATSQLMGAMEERGLGSLAQVLSAMGLREGLDMQGSAALLIFDIDQPNPSDGVLLLPISDRNAFLTSLAAKEDDGLFKLSFGGADYVARVIDDHLIALAPSRERLRALELAPGRQAANLAPSGPRGKEIAERAPIIALASGPAMGALAGALMPQIPQIPGAAPGEGPLRALAARLNLADTTGVVLGLEPGPLGLRVDLAAGFKEDSFMFRVCKGDAEDPEPFKSLPRQDYLLAGSLNSAHDGVRTLIDELGPGPAAVGAYATAYRSIVRSLADISTASVAVFAPPNLMMGALGRTVVAWESKTPHDACVAFQSWLKDLSRLAPEGAPIKTSYDVGAQDVGKVKADTWTIEPAAGALPLAAMLLNPGASPAGLCAATEKIGYLTTSRDAALLGAAIEAGAGPAAKTLQGDTMRVQVSDLLPRPRAAEAYLDVRPLVKQAKMMLGRRGGLGGDLPDALPPIGAAIVMDGGGFQASAFLPAAVMRIGAAILRQRFAPDPNAVPDPPPQASLK